MPFVIKCQLEGQVRVPKPKRWWETDGWYQRRLRNYQADAMSLVCAAQDTEGVPKGAPIPNPVPYGQRFVLKEAFDCPEYGPYENRDAAQLLVDKELNPKANSVWNMGLIGDIGIGGAVGTYRAKFFVAETQG